MPQGLTASLINMAFSGYEKPVNQKKISLNLLRASLQFILVAGTVAVPSFVYNRSLWSPLPSYAAACCFTPLQIAFSIINILYQSNNHSNTFYARLNQNLSIIETGSALLNLFLAAVLTPGLLKMDQRFSDRFFYPFLGLGITALGFKIFHLYQNWQHRLLDETLSKDLL